MIERLLLAIDGYRHFKELIELPDILIHGKKLLICHIIKVKTPELL